MLTVPDAAPDPERRVLESGCARQLRRLREALKEPYRSTALLYFVRERSFSGDRRRHRPEPETVGDRVYRAKAQLKK